MPAETSGGRSHETGLRKESKMLEQLKQEVYEANMQLPKLGPGVLYLGERFRD